MMQIIAALALCHLRSNGCCSRIAMMLNVNVLGGMMGVVLVGALMTNEVSRGMFLTSHERFTKRVKGEGRSSLKPMASAGIWTATILTGLLTSLTIVVVLSIVLYATIWTLDDL
jgi:hypothetical protein